MYDISERETPNHETNKASTQHVGHDHMTRANKEKKLLSRHHMAISRYCRGLFETQGSSSDWQAWTTYTNQTHAQTHQDIYHIFHHIIHIAAAAATATSTTVFYTCDAPLHMAQLLKLIVRWQSSA